MNTQTDAPSYILGNSPNAELRLELLDEVTCLPFIEAMGVLPKRKLRILNIGCGSGHLEARLSSVFSESCFVGIDISAQRIEEARARTGALKCSNTYAFIQDDLTTLEVNQLEPCDILISRLVLSHLQNPLDVLKRFLPLVRPGGFVCLEEGASDCSEYFCNTNNVGYRTFVKMIDIQIQEQKSLFDIGFRLLTELTQLPGKVLHCRLAQAILRNARHKSILRLGIEDAKPTFLKQMEEGSLEEIISSLRQFEKDDLAFGLYLRTMAVIAQTAE